MKKQLLCLLGLLFYTFFCSNLYSQNTGTSLDQDSNSFEWIKYGDQYWSVVNAEVETYRDGTPIPYIEDQTVWKDLTIGAWCYYENDSTDEKTYGKLYNWYAVAGIFDEASLNDASLRKEFAPTGFRVPNNDDWNEFYQYMISAGFNFDNSTSGNKLAKSLASVQLWNSSGVNGSPGLNKESNNSSLFNAIPVGLRAGCCFTDYFGSRGIQTYFWLINEHDQNNSVCSYINFEDYKSNFQNNFKTDGYSVRFVSSEKPINNLDILLNGTVSAEDNQIKNVADPTHTQDAATKGYVDSNLNSFSGSYNDLTDTPTMYTQAQVNALISNLQSQISDLKGEVVDNEGNVYSSVQLGDQLWTTINAENTTYRDGTAIPQVTDLNTWPNLTTGAWCYIDNDPSKGKLYNWFAVVGIHNEASLTDTSLRKEFAPQGWKIPSNDDFSLLVNYLIANGYNHDGTVTGNKLAKSLASQSGWGVTTGNGLPGTDQSLNNSSGFNALPVGVYKFNGTGWYFLNKGSEADFWTLTEHDSDEDLARYAALIFDRDWLTQWYIPKNNGASVRFIKE